MAQKTAAITATDQVWGKGRRIAFYAAVALSLAAMLITGPLLTLPVTAWLPESTLDAMFGEEGLGIHRVHMVGASLLFWMTVVAMVAQFRHPERTAAPLWAPAAGLMVFLPLELTHLIDPYSIVLTVLVLTVLALHPRRWPSAPITSRYGPRLLAVPFAVAAVVYAYQQAMWQLNAIPEHPHAVVSHFELMTAVAVGLAVSALLGATDFPGRVISAWTAGISTLILGIFFIGHPDQMSSLGVGWGSALVVWSLAYLTKTIRHTRKATGQPAGSST